jgi:hypothetical protein
MRVAHSRSLVHSEQVRRIATALVTALAVGLTAGAAQAKEPRIRVAQYQVTQAQGTVKITFQGSEAAGCRARGVCGISGSTTYSFGGKPQFGAVFWARQHKRTIGFYGFFETAGETASDVVSAGSDEHCVDRTSHATDSMSFEPRSRRVRFEWREQPAADEESVVIGGDEEDPFDTRCAGPHLADLHESRAIPFADVPYRVFRSRKSSFTTTGSRPFAGGGFAGQVDWTLSYGLRFDRTRGGGWFAAPIG